MNTDATNENTTSCENPTCRVCGCIESRYTTLIDSSAFDGDDEPICEDCLHDNGYECCADCGDWSDDFVIVDDGYRSETLVCEECAEGNYYRCEDCRDYYSAEHLAGELNSGGVLCENCYENRGYCMCDECGEIFPEHEVHWSDERGAYLCEDCFDSCGYSDAIHEYHWRPQLRPRGYTTHVVDVDQYSPDTPLLFGVELEVDQGDDRTLCGRAIDEAFEDEVWMQRDSSVDFEIVTHPFTLDYHRYALDWEGLCAIPPKYGYQSHDAGTCGLHVHVGRAQLGSNFVEQQYTIKKIMLLMLRHRTALVAFSRRSEGQLRRWAKYPKASELWDELTRNVGGEAWSDEQLLEAACGFFRDTRYMALNIQNRNTIEFRLWRGSLRPETVLATLELTSNICEYAMSHSVSEILDSSWTNLLKLADYPELKSYASTRVPANALTGSEATMPHPAVPLAAPRVEDSTAMIEPTEPGNDFLPIGTHVRFTHPSIFIAQEITDRRAEGVVVAVHPGSPLPYTIYLLDADCRLEYGHDATRHHSEPLPLGDYYYFASRQDLDVVETRGASQARIRVGDTVLAHLPETSGAEPGWNVGVVKCFDRAGGQPFIGVAFENSFSTGHGLFGVLPGDSQNGWFCFPTDLLVLTPAPQD